MPIVTDFSFLLPETENATLAILQEPKDTRHNGDLKEQLFRPIGTSEKKQILRGQSETMQSLMSLRAGRII